MANDYRDVTPKGMCEICEVRKGKKRKIRGIMGGSYCDICYNEIMGG